MTLTVRPGPLVVKLDHPSPASTLNEYVAPILNPVTVKLVEETLVIGTGNSYTRYLIAPITGVQLKVTVVGVMFDAVNRLPAGHIGANRGCAPKGFING